MFQLLQTLVRDLSFRRLPPPTMILLPPNYTVTVIKSMRQARALMHGGPISKSNTSKIHKTRYISINPIPSKPVIDKTKD